MTNNEIYLPCLYKLDSVGRQRYVEIRVVGNIYFSRAGLLKTRDNHTWKPHKKSAQYDQEHGSHRSGEEVALQHAWSDWREKKRNDAMTEDLDTLNGDVYHVPIAPVLAKRYSDLVKMNETYQARVQSGKKPTKTMYCFPDHKYMVQYKFDGERATISWVQEMNGNHIGEYDVHIFSRLRVEVPHLDHIKAIYRKIYTKIGKKNPWIYGCHFDGEIMEPGQTRNKMRSTISRIKEKHVDNENITHYVFDMVVEQKPDMPFRERYRILSDILGRLGKDDNAVRLVPIIGEVRLGTSEVDDMLALALDHGMEGIIARDPEMLYPSSGFRVNQMIKCKNINDCDYRILGAIQGTDAHEGLIVWHVQDLVHDFVTFYVTPKWSHEDRRNAWEMYCEDPDQFVGKLITVIYRDKEPNTLVPIEARATRIRDPSDMDVAEAKKSYGSRRSNDGE